MPLKAYYWIRSPIYYVFGRNSRGIGAGAWLGLSCGSIYLAVVYIAFRYRLHEIITSDD